MGLPMTQNIPWEEDRKFRNESSHSVVSSKRSYVLLSLLTFGLFVTFRFSSKQKVKIHKRVTDGKYAEHVRHRPLIISGPSGVGKGTLIDKLLNFYNHQWYYYEDDESEFSVSDVHFKFSVSHTTRKPRPGEVDGVHYHFTNKEHMLQEIKEGKFIEYAEVHGNLYGTSYSSVQSVIDEGHIVILDIDVQGARKVQESDSIQYPLSIFIAPPSMSTLERRLRDRRTENEESIQRRIENARKEVEYGTKKGSFDEVVVNDDLELAFLSLRHILEERYPHLNTIPSDEHVEF